MATDFSQMSASERASVIQDYVTQTLAAGGTAADIAAAMNQYNVSPAEVAGAMNADIGQVQATYNQVSPGGMFSTTGTTTGNLGLAGLSQAANVVKQQQAAAPAQPSGGVPDNVKAALESPKLTQDQYNTLAAYFGNDMVLNEASRDPNKPTIKDFVGKRSGYEFSSFLASRGPEQGNTGNAAQAYQGLLAPYQGKEVNYRVDTDSETGNTRYFVNDPFTGKEQEVFQQADGTFKGYVGNLSGQEQGGMSEGSFNLGTTYNFDPATGKATVGAPTINYQAPESGLGGLGTIAAIGLGVAFPGLGTALGTSLGLSGAAASALGNALIGGLTTGAITGDLEKGLIAGAMAGLGTYGVESGLVGEAMDSLGLGQFKSSLGVPGGLPTTPTGLATSTAAPGSLQQYLSQQGLTTAGATPVPGSLGDYLSSVGINPLSLGGAAAGTSGLLTGAADTALGSGIKLPGNAGDMLGVGTASAGLAGGVAGGTGLTPGAAGVTGIGAGAAGAGAGLLGSAAGSSVAGTLSNLLGNQTLQGLLGAGIDYATLNAIANEAQATGRSVADIATQAGAAANIPFTPYTVTTGAGTTAFGTNAAGQPTATVSAAPEYEALRQQAIQASGQALGSIAPGTYSQSLYDRARALAAPTEQRQQEQLLSNLGAKGLLGISRNLPTTGGTTAGVNPYLESLLSSQRTADVNLALQAQQAGTQEAQRQAALAQALQSQAQGIDTQALQTLTQGANIGATATQLNQAGAARQLAGTLSGLELRSPYEQTAFQARSGGLLGLGGVARGAIGLPTQQGNTGSSNVIGNLINTGINELFRQNRDTNG